MIRLLYFLFCILQVGSLQAEGFATVKGRVSGEQQPLNIQLMRVENGVPVEYAGTSIASGGSFAFMLEPEENQPYYYLYDGKGYCRLYLQAGVETEVVWEDQNFRVIQSGSEENRLLETWREMERELKGDQKSDTYGAFFPRFESVRKNVNNWLSEVERILPNYVTELKEIVELDLLNHFVMYVAKRQQNYESEEQESAYYQQIMKSFPEKDSRLLKQPYGMELLNNYFTYKQTVMFRARAYTMEERLAELNVPELKAEYILAKIPTTDYRRYCEYERYYMLLLPESYRQRMRHLQERPVSILQPGELAPNLMYPDTNGQLHSMADFKGKYKYIDIWATWCVPCKKEIPSLQSLEKELEGQDIVFISISIDKNRKAWKDFVRVRQLGGTQLWAGDWTELPHELKLGSVPRFMLIDPEGRWVDVNASRPSDPKLKEILKKLLGK